MRNSALTFFANIFENILTKFKKYEYNLVYTLLEGMC
jgi:hypothetical protein